MKRRNPISKVIAPRTQLIIAVTAATTAAVVLRVTNPGLAADAHYFKAAEATLKTMQKTGASVLYETNIGEFMLVAVPTK